MWKRIRHLFCVAAETLGTSTAPEQYYEVSGNRIRVRCACGHVSPGWEMDSPRYRYTYAGDPERLRLNA